MEVAYVIEDRAAAENIPDAFFEGLLLPVENEAVENRVLLRVEQNYAFLWKLCVSEPRWDGDESSYLPTTIAEWERLGAAIRQNTELKAISFGLGLDEVPTDHLEAFARAMQGNSSISEFEVRDCNRRIGAIFQCFTTFLETNCILTELSLINCRIRADAVQSLSRALARCSKSLKTVHFTSMEISDAILAGLILSINLHHPQLEKLSLFECDIGRRGCMSLASLLKYPQSRLKELRLEDTNIGDDGLECLSMAIAESKELATLVFWGNTAITRRGLDALSASLQTSQIKLKKLNLRDCSIDDHGILTLSSGLAECKSLVELDVSDNPSITALGWGAFSVALSQSGLQELSLEGNGIDARGIEVLLNGMKNTSLISLNLRRNPFIVGEGLKKLSRALRTHELKLKKLYLRENNMTDNDLYSLAEGLANNRTLITLHLDDNNITRAGWSQFQKILCNESSINNTYFSNHVLEEVVCWGDRRVPDSLHSLLVLNSKSDKKSVAAKKVFDCHLIGDIGFKKFIHLKPSLMVDAIAWTGTPLENDLVSKKSRLSAFFQLMKTSAMVETMRYHSLYNTTIHRGKFEYE